MPNTLVSEFFCGLARDVGKRWLSFTARAVLSVGRSRTIAKHRGFRGFLDHTMMGKGVFLSLFGWVSLIGGVVWGFGCGFGWGVRGVLRIVFLIPANPFQAQSLVLKSLFLPFRASPCGIVG